MTNEDKIKRWLAGELSDTERTEFEGAEEYAKLDRLMKAVNNFKAPAYDVDKESTRLSENVICNKPTISLYKRISPVFRIAAIFIVTLTIGYFLFDQFNRIPDNQRWMAEQSGVYLPDSSFVLINTDSKIRFAEKKWGKERNVELQGEAFFRVKKGSQFNVKTQQGRVTVLGTEFGVKDRDRYYEVTCYSGSVKVVTEKHSIVLKPGQAFRVVNGIEENYIFSDQSEPDWLKGESNFKSVPFRFVINELERQYNISVEAENVDLNQLFTGGFTHNNLEIALQSITVPVNLNYEMTENKIVITVEGQ